MIHPVVSVLILAVLVCVTGFALNGHRTMLNRQRLSMVSPTKVLRNACVAALVGATSTVFTNYQSVRAEIDYDGVKYLGGGDKVDLNNANIRAYLKIPGLYPTIASKIVNNGPFKSVQDVFNIPSLSSSEKEVLKKAESRFVVLEGKPEYVIDKINNGLYK